MHILSTYNRMHSTLVLLLLVCTRVVRNVTQWRFNYSTSSSHTKPLSKETDGRSSYRNYDHIVGEPRRAAESCNWQLGIEDLIFHLCPIAAPICHTAAAAEPNTGKSAFRRRFRLLAENVGKHPRSGRERVHRGAWSCLSDIFEPLTNSTLAEDSHSVIQFRPINSS